MSGLSIDSVDSYAGSTDVWTESYMDVSTSILRPYQMQDEPDFTVKKNGAFESRKHGSSINNSQHLSLTWKFPFLYEATCY